MKAIKKFIYSIWVYMNNWWIASKPRIVRGIIQLNIFVVFCIGVWFVISINKPIVPKFSGDYIKLTLSRNCYNLNYENINYYLLSNVKTTYSMDMVTLSVLNRNGKPKISYNFNCIAEIKYFYMKK